MIIYSIHVGTFQYDGGLLLFYHSEVNFVVSSGYDNYHAWSQHICQSARYIILYKSLPVGRRFEHVYLSKYLSLPVRLYGLSTTCTQQLFLLLPRTYVSSASALRVTDVFCLSLPHHTRTLHTHTHTYYIYIILLFIIRQSGRRRRRRVKSFE